MDGRCPKPVPLVGHRALHRFSQILGLLQDFVTALNEDCLRRHGNHGDHS
jgi:hypothetical protein